MIRPSAIPDDQAEIAAFLAGLTGGAPIETHISAIFRAPDAVLKLKKAVRLEFLDFSTLDARRHFLERELAVNREGAPGLYRDVVPIRRTPTGLALGGEAGEIIDYVLRMARVPEGDFLEAIVTRGDVTPDLLDAVGDAVAAYHARLPPADAGDPLAALLSVAAGNAAAARAAGLPEAAVTGWEAAMRAALTERADWLRRRAAAGLVRRAHGDLHLGNVCLWDGRPVLFDALEFDEALATIDLGYDLAFLLMDLDLRVGRAAANRVMNRVLARSGDWGMAAGLPPFLSMRAMVRAHVEARRGHDFAAYLDAAAAYLRPEPGVALAIGGLQGSGKTTLARALAPALGRAPGALHLRSDELRKRLHGRDFTETLPQDGYSPAANARTDIALLAALQEAAETGQAVVADATFLDPGRRIAAAAATGGRLRGIWLDAPLAVLESRVAARTGDASDATVEVLRQAASRNVGPGPESPGPESPGPESAVRENPGRERPGWHHIDATDGDAALAAIRGLAATGPDAILPAS